MISAVPYRKKYLHKNMITPGEKTWRAIHIGTVEDLEAIDGKSRVREGFGVLHNLDDRRWWLQWIVLLSCLFGL